MRTDKDLSLSTIHTDKHTTAYTQAKNSCKVSKVDNTEALACKQACIVPLLISQSRTSKDTQTQLNQRAGFMLMHANSLIAPPLSLGSVFKTKQRSSIVGSDKQIN